MPHLQTHLLLPVDTLEYLRLGGCIGCITALAGTMLSIKAIITFSDDGQLGPVHR